MELNSLRTNVHLAFLPAVRAGKKAIYKAGIRKSKCRRRKSEGTKEAKENPRRKLRI